MRGLRNFGLFLSMSALLAAGSAAAQQMPRTTFDLQTAVKTVLDETHTPGAGIAVIDARGEIWAGGVGMADVAGGREATGDTLFRAGSISKSFVAVAVMMLVEDGVLDLNDPVAGLAPEVPFTNPWAATAPVRVAHLLEHTTGFDDIHLPEYAYRDPKATLLHALQYHPDSRVSRVPPGQYFSYSNSGPGIAAYLVEKRSGMLFEEFVRQRIFAPLGMNTASWQPDEATDALLARGYWDEPGEAAPYEHLTPRPAGALNASPRELALFVRLLIDRGRAGGRTLLRPASVERIENPATTLAVQAGLTIGHGLGSYVRLSDGYLWHGHSGGLSNFAANYAYLPGRRVGYVLMINAADGEAYRRIDELMRKYVTANLTPPPSVESINASEPQLAQWTGFYEPIVTRPELARFLTNLVGLQHVSTGSGTLLMRSPLGDSERLLPLGNGLFRRAADPVATIVFMRHEGATIAQGPMLGDGSLRRIDFSMAVTRLVAMSVCLLLMLSTLPYALVWIPRRLFGHPYFDLGPRVLPLLAVLTLCGWFALFFLTDDILGQFGLPTPRAYALWLLGWLFALISLVSLWRSLGGASPGLRAYSGLVSFACVAVAGYLYYWGVLGLRTWDY